MRTNQTHGTRYLPIRARDLEVLRQLRVQQRQREIRQSPLASREAEHLRARQDVANVDAAAGRDAVVAKEEPSVGVNGHAGLYYSIVDKR